MHEENNKKLLVFVKKILTKIKPRFSFHYIAYTTLITFVVFSIVSIVSATTPNPGHPWSELGDGVFTVANTQTLNRTYTFPDANATMLTTNATVTVAQGGTGIGTLASNGVLYGNGTGAVQALAVNAGATLCLTQTTSGVPTWGACGGGGKVTAIGVTTANGVSGSSSGGTTPNLTITLGAITPTSVNSVVISGSTTPTLAVTGTSSITGANTGDNSANTTYASDYRLANFVAGTNYLAPNGNGSALTGLTGGQITGNISGSAGTLTTSRNI